MLRSAEGGILHLAVEGFEHLPMVFVLIVNFFFPLTTLI
jgi:hypothetical protein